MKIKKFKKKKKSLLLLFVYRKEYISLNNIKHSLRYYISSKILLALQDIWNKIMNTNVHIDYTSLVDVALWPKILGNRLGLLTSIVIGMDYFFRCQKRIFNLENNKSMPRKLFCIPRN